MTKVTMPKPVAWRNWSAMSSKPSLGFDRHDELSSDALITTDQAEAYAAAKVQEMLHEEAKPDNIKRAEFYGAGYGAGWKSALERAIKAIESCRTTGTIRSGTIEASIEAIRDLIPK